MNSNKTNSILDQIFSHPVYKSSDANALKRHVLALGDVGQAYAELNRQTGSSADPVYPINRIGESTLYLVQPGTFVLQNDVTWTATVGNYSAIVILSDNVTLDLNGYSITCIINAPGVKRSTISTSGFSNVTIKNGTLINSYYCGINADSTTGLALEKVTIKGVTFKSTGGQNYPAGVNLSNCSDIFVSQVTVQDVQVTADTGAGALMTNCNRGCITGLVLRSLHNANGSMQGFTQMECKELMTRDSAVTDLSTDSIAGSPSSASTAIGFMPTGCTGLYFVNCEAYDIRGCCDDCHGMSVFLCMDVVVQNFRAREVVDGRPPYNAGAKATGLEVYGSDITIQDCQVSGIVAHGPEDLQSSGFSAWGDDIHFIGCSASDVSVVGTPPAGQSYYAVGFGWAPDPRPEFSIGDATNVTYSNCSATNCAIGFDTFRHVNSSWTQWTSSGCATPVLQASGSRTITCCACSECNPPITATVPNSAGGNSFNPVPPSP